jgi:Flp pilus assembly protein TadG
MKSKRATRRTRGQALIEMAVSIIALFWLTISIIEFGRMMMVTNMITHAMRDGARAAAVVSKDKRCQSNGFLTAAEQGVIKTQVNQLISDVGVSGLTISITGGTSADGTPIVTCSAAGSVSYLYFGASQNIARAVTFRDEVATGTAGC